MLREQQGMPGGDAPTEGRTAVEAMLVAALAVALMAFALVVRGYRRELRRMARFLRTRPPESNQRLTVQTTLPGTSELAAAVNGQLDRQAEEGRAQHRAEQEFQRNLASLSHDIRTPLTGAKGYLQLAAAENDDASERARCLGLAQSRLNAMQTLLDQLFDYCRSLDAAREPVREPVDALAVLSEVLAGHFPEFAERGWEPALDWQDPALPLMGDREALSRIFENLVANALRYGTGDFTVTQRGRRLVFGNDMAATDAASLDAERLFDRFYRGDAARSESGAGLGLSVVRNLATSLDAQVSAAVLRPEPQLARADAPAQPTVARFEITLVLP